MYGRKRRSSAVIYGRCKGLGAQSQDRCGIPIRRLGTKVVVRLFYLDRLPTPDSEI